MTMDTSSLFELRRTKDTSSLFELRRTKDTSSLFELRRTKDTSSLFEIRKTKDISSLFELRRTKDTSSLFELRRTKDTSSLFELRRTKDTSSLFELRRTKDTSSLFELRRTKDRCAKGLDFSSKWMCCRRQFAIRGFESAIAPHVSAAVEPPKFVIRNFLKPPKYEQVFCLLSLSEAVLCLFIRRSLKSEGEMSLPPPLLFFAAPCVTIKHT